MDLESDPRKTDAGEKGKVKLSPEWRAALAEGVELVSFDLFDTLIMRSSGSPASVFLEVGRRHCARLGSEVGPELFMRLRGEAEDRARRNSRREEVSLGEIYEELGHSVPLPADKATLVALEEEVESECIRVLPGMREVVEQVREVVGRVCFTTDIYLPEELLRRVLEREQLIRSGDGLYVSSTHGVQKFRSGGLFEYMLQRERLRADQVLHCGNSSLSDIVPATKRGLRVLHLPEGNPSGSEAILEKSEALTRGVSGWLSAAARATRYEGQGLRGGQKTAWETGASVTGPLAFCYGRWVVDMARKHELTHLLFLARDAHFPFEAVKRQLAWEGETRIKISYFYGSRPTYYALSVSKLDSSAWDALTSFGGSGYSSLESLGRILMVKPETLIAVAESAGVDCSDPKRELPESELAALKESVVGDAENQERCLRDLREYQDGIRELLAGEGIGASSKVGLVDTGWTTKSHAPLFHFVRESGCGKVRLLYLGLAGPQCAVPAEDVDTFLFNQHTRKGDWLRGFNYARPMESLFMASHGRTEQFVRKEGELEPVLAPLENAHFIEEFYPGYQDAVLAFLDKTREFPQEEVSGVVGMSQVASEIIHRFWNEPTSAEARLWSQLSYEWDPLGEVRYPLARAYSWDEVIHCLREGKWPEPHPQFWVAGARALSPRRLHLTMRVVLGLRRRARDLVRGFPGSLSGSMSEMAQAVRRFTA